MEGSFRDRYGVRPRNAQSSSGIQRLAQMINAERWFHAEVERLKREGWTVDGDMVYKEKPNETL